MPAVGFFFYGIIYSDSLYTVDIESEGCVAIIVIESVSCRNCWKRTGGHSF